MRILKPFIRYVLNRSFSTFVATINFSMQLDELYAKALNFDMLTIEEEPDLEEPATDIDALEEEP